MSRDGFVDLHIHTILSDGDVTPEEVVAEACRMGLEGIAITDHDEIAGVRMAIEYAPPGFWVIPGVELSTSDGKTDIHVLGYFVNTEDENLLSYLKLFRDARLRRGIEIVERLRLMGVKIEVESVLEMAGGGVVGRPHIAAALVRNGCVESIEDAFRNYIGFNSPAYVPKYHLKPINAFKLIAQAGGIGAMAHPGTTRRDDLIVDFVAAGMRAIEVYHPKHSESDIERYSQIACKLGLVATGGSDSHGKRDGTMTIGMCKVPASVVASLEAVRRY